MMVPLATQWLNASLTAVSITYKSVTMARLLAISLYVARACLVSRSQTTFFRLHYWGGKKWSGYVRLELVIEVISTITAIYGALAHPWACSLMNYNNIFSMFA